MCNYHKLGGFIFGAFLIVFTFVDWSVAKWITFGIGILLVLHSFVQKKFCGDVCFTEKPIKKVVKKKVKK